MKVYVVENCGEDFDDVEAVPVVPGCGVISVS